MKDGGGSRHAAEFMARALRLAHLGLYTTDPNPRVGCVIEKNGVVVGEGWHARAGEPHAEVLALRSASESARDATLYVTLEPCCHQGRTPPCTDALIKSGVKQVVVAIEDPNPKVGGKGIAALKAARIAVEVGVLAAAAEALNRGFFRRMAGGFPYIRAKSAMSLDAKTALANGVSQWITSDDARQDVHRWRARSSAIVTGIGTVLADDPLLSARLPEAGCAVKQPMRVILDSHLRIPPSARVLGEGCLVFTAASDRMKFDSLLATGTEVIRIPAQAGGRLDLRAVLSELARRGCNELWVEAGPMLTGSFIREGLVDEYIVYLAPHVLGHQARALMELPLLENMADRASFEWSDVRRIGGDLRLILRPKFTGQI